MPTLAPSTQLFKESLQFVKSHWKQLLGLWAFSDFPPKLLGFIVGARSDISSQSELINAITEANWSVLGPLLIVGSFSLVLGLIGYLIIIKMTLNSNPNREIDLFDYISQSLSTLPAAIAVSLLSSIAIYFGTAFLILPGLYLLVRLCFSLWFTAVDDLKPIASIRKSFEYSDGYFWSLSARLGSIFAIAFGASLLLTVVEKFLLFIASLTGPITSLVVLLLTTPVQFLIAAWVISSMTGLFLLMPQRHEIKADIKESR